jgi:hypothetical protein
MTRRTAPRATRRKIWPALLLVLSLAASACGGTSAAPTKAPDPADPSTAPIPSNGDPASAGASTGTTAAASPVTKALPPSIGNAKLFHLQLATDIDDQGNPIGQSTAFPTGTKLIFGLLAWHYVPLGTELRLRLFQGDRLITEAAHQVVDAGASLDNNVGFVYPFSSDTPFPDGGYTMAVDYNGVQDEIVPFTVGDGPLADPVLGSGSQTGGIPYANPADVLVVTRMSVLRANLGADADRVFAAASLDGDLHDLEADGVTRSTPDAAVAEVHRLLKARTYRYLLILGNDDAVPYFHFPNPEAAGDAPDLEGSELPVDWVASDDEYTDLDGDQYGIPDIAVARIPSSDDTTLLLKQLGENIPPDGSAYVLLNQERRSQAGLLLSTMADIVKVRITYAPPADPESFAGSGDAAQARYLYVLLHGIGTKTDTWWTNTGAWAANDQQNPLDHEWTVYEADQVKAVTVQSNPTSTGVVQVGACYGAWTLDTIKAPTHKTADNNLALHYLKGGARAFIADTHISYSYAMSPGDTPLGRTGFEYLYWDGLRSGLSPIDAFQQAEVRLGPAIDALRNVGEIDAAAATWKTLHYMVYLGRP